MKLRTILLTLLIAIFYNIGIAHAEEARYTLNVANFNSLTVVDGINVVYRCNADSAGWVVFTAEPELASKISFTNNKEHLRVQTLADEQPIRNLPTVTVYSASLRYVENSGDSTVVVYPTVQVQKFTAKQIGNGVLDIRGVSVDKLDGDAAAGHGRLSIDGKADKVKLRNVGTGIIDASTLAGDDVSCFVLGPGTVHVHATGQLKLTGAGSGKVINHATAAKNVNRSIGIKAENPGEQKP